MTSGAERVYLTDPQSGMLVLLVERAPDVVDKDALAKAGWGGALVSRAGAVRGAERQCYAASTTKEDLFQEMAIQVWRSMDAHRGDSSVPTWENLPRQRQLEALLKELDGR